MPAAITSPPEAGQGAAPLDVALLSRPLEYLVVEHLRQRDLCAVLDRIGDAVPLDRDLAAGAADRIDRELAMHVLDDEEDLYPLLRRRAVPEDRVEGVLGLLAGEHAAGSRSAGVIAARLRAASQGATLDGADGERIRAFTQRLRRHLAVENAMLMPLAEARLSPADLAGLARRMAARRGVLLGSAARG